MRTFVTILQKEKKRLVTSKPILISSVWNVIQNRIEETTESNYVERRMIAASRVAGGKGGFSVSRGGKALFIDRHAYMSSA